MLHKFRKKIGVLSWLFILMFTVSCSSSGSGSSSSSSSSTSSTNDSSSTNTGSTSAITISGDVDVSESDISNLQSSDVEARSSLLVLSAISNISEEDQLSSLKKTAVEGATARLYTIDDEGELLYTGFETLVVDGKYTFADIDLDISTNSNYVVKIKKKGYDAQGNVHMFESEAYVPITATEATSGSTIQANVSPKTTAVSTYVRGKIAESDVIFTPEQVDIIIELVVDLIDQGIVQAPDVVKISSEDEDLFDDEDVLLTSSDTASQLASTLDTNDNILEINQENVAKAQITKSVSAMTEAEAVTFIRNVFGVASSSNDSDDRGASGKGNEGPGDFFINQFANAYLTGKTASIADLAQALVDSGVPISTSELTTIIDNRTTDTLTKVYNYYDGLAEKPDVDNFPVVKAVFPKDNRIDFVNDKVPTDLQLNVPQMVLIFGIAGLFEDDFQFDPMTFTQKIGFVEIEQNTVYIMSSHVMPVSMWAPTGEKDEQGWDIWDEVSTLFAEVEVFGLDEEGNAISESDFDRVIMTYPKANNETGSVELESMNYDDFENDTTTVSPKKITDITSRVNAKRTTVQLKKYNDLTSNVADGTEDNQPHDDMSSSIRFEFNPWGNGSQKSSDELITDFETGTITFKAFLTSGDEPDAIAEQTIIKVDLEDIQWVFPAGPDMETVNEMGWDPEYVPTIIPLEDDKTSIEGGVVKWSKPSATELGNIPSTSELVYSIDIGLTAHPKNWDSEMSIENDFDSGFWDWSDSWFAYKHVWDSWQKGTFIKGTQFKLPISLNETENGEDTNYVTEYEINIRPLLRNKTSKMIEWEGRPSRTNFKVGTPPSWEVAINGCIYFPTEFIQNEAQYEQNDGVWKVGLFKMDGMVTDGSSRQWSDVFYELGNNDSRLPIANGSGDLLVATLGTSAELAEDGQVEFNLPAVSNEDDIFERNMNYRFLVWYDLTEKPTNSDWEDVNLVDDGIEFSDAPIFTYALEKHFQDNGNIRFDNGAVIYEQWNQNYADMFILSNSTDEKIELNPFSWMTFDKPENNNGSSDTTYNDDYDYPNPSKDEGDDHSLLIELSEEATGVFVNEDGSIVFAEGPNESTEISSAGIITIYNDDGTSEVLDTTVSVSFESDEVVIEDADGNEIRIVDGVMTYTDAADVIAIVEPIFTLSDLDDSNGTYVINDDNSITFIATTGEMAIFESNGQLTLVGIDGLAMDTSVTMAVSFEENNVIIEDADGNKISIVDGTFNYTDADDTVDINDDDSYPNPDRDENTDSSDFSLADLTAYLTTDTISVLVDESGNIIFTDEDNNGSATISPEGDITLILPDSSVINVPFSVSVEFIDNEIVITGPDGSEISIVDGTIRFTDDDENSNENENSDSNDFSLADLTAYLTIDTISILVDESGNIIFTDEDNNGSATISPEGDITLTLQDSSVINVPFSVSIEFIDNEIVITGPDGSELIIIDGTFNFTNGDDNTSI